MSRSYDTEKTDAAFTDQDPLKDGDVALPGGLTEVVLRSSLVDGGQQQLAYDGRRRQLDGRSTFAVCHRNVRPLTDEQLHHLQIISQT